VLGGVDLRLPFWVAAGLSLANAAYGLFVLPESLPPERRAGVGWKFANPIGSLRFLRSTKGIAGLAIVTFVSFLAHESLPGVWVLYTAYRYGWSERMVGASLAFVGLASTVVAAALTGMTVKRLGERSTLLIGLGCGMIGLAAFGLAPTSALVFAGVPFVSAWGLAGPACQSLMTRQADPSAQGKLQGAVSSLRGITGMIGPLVYTQTLRLSIEHGSIGVPGLAYLLAASLLLVGLVTAVVVTRRAEA
jgi:DHA1 family tetracycline resistance protein-like MFS transporter